MGIQAPSQREKHLKRNGYNNMNGLDHKPQRVKIQRERLLAVTDALSNVLPVQQTDGKTSRQAPHDYHGRKLDAPAPCPHFFYVASSSTVPDRVHLVRVRWYSQKCSRQSQHQNTALSHLITTHICSRCRAWSVYIGLHIAVRSRDNDASA